jgi:DNA-binding response OmpR family regulator
MRILIVEDEEKLANALKEGLEHKGHAVDVVGDGKTALTRISLYQKDYDAVVLDLMLPLMDGVEVCRTARERGVNVPILVLTALNETDRKIDLLQIGADDYMAKPFAFEELLARLNALTRRPHTVVPAVITVGDVELDTGRRVVQQDGKPVALTLREFALLEYLMRNANRVLNREEITSHVWDFNFASLSNIVDVHVKNLRRKLSPAGRCTIETVRGVGYRLTG